MKGVDFYTGALAIVQAEIRALVSEINKRFGSTIGTQLVFLCEKRSCLEDSCLREVERREYLSKPKEMK